MKFYFDTETNTAVKHEEGIVIDGFIEISEDKYIELTSIASDKTIVTDNNAPLIVSASAYYYSATENAFFPAILQTSYKNAGSWSAKGKWVDESVFTEFATSPAPAGKMRVAGKNGMPTWGDLPKPTKEQLIAESEQQKQLLADEAEKNITILERKVRLGMATDDEKDSLVAWEIYSIKVSDIDTSTAPDIDWPQKP
ncbi:TPA: tail fiber assembly protein [Providencia alcalifaciens]